MALTLQDLLLPTPGPARPDTRGQTGPADPASDAFAALFNSATSNPQAPDTAPPPRRDETTEAVPAPRPRHDDRSSSDTKPSADSDATKSQSDRTPTKTDAKDGNAPAKPATSAHHHHHHKKDAAQAPNTGASADSTTADVSSSSASTGTGSVPATPASLFQVLLLASQPDAAAPSPSSGAAPSPSSGAAVTKATPAPLTAASLAAPVPALPASTQAATDVGAAQPEAPNPAAAPAGLVVGLEKALATVPSPAPTADANVPAVPVASQLGVPASPTVPATTAAPGDIAVLALTLPPNGGAKTPATQAGATPRDAATTATAPTDAALNATAPLSPAAVPAPQTLSNRLSDTALAKDPKTVQDSAGKPDSQAPSAPDAAAAAKTSAAGPSVALATTVQPATLATSDAGNSVNAPAGAPPVPDPSLAGAVAPPSVAPVADAHRAQVAYTAAAGSSGALPQVTLDRVVLHLTKAADDGLDQLTIHLKPAELGAIEVKLEMGNDGLNKATISADRPDTLNLLQQDSHHLAQALDNAGIKTDPGSLSFNLRGDGGGRFAQGFAQQQGGGHQHAAPAYVPRTLNNSPLPDSTAILGYLNTRAALGGVDIRV